MQRKARIFYTFSDRTLPKKNKKAFQQDEYRLLANSTYFSYHQMSLGRGFNRSSVLATICLLAVGGRGVLNSDVPCPRIGPCMVRSNASAVMGPPCEQIDMTENITFPQLLWRAVINRNTDLVSILQQNSCERLSNPLGTSRYYGSFPRHVTSHKQIAGLV